MKVQRQIQGFFAPLRMTTSALRVVAEHVRQQQIPFGDDNKKGNNHNNKLQLQNKGKGYGGSWLCFSVFRKRLVAGVGGWGTG
jgi:hypothetical protein